MPTPQELMDMPFAGQAEKELRKRGMWRLTTQEKLVRAMDGLDAAIDEARGYYDDAWCAMTKETLQ